MHLLVGGPAGAGNVFLACEDEKKLELFRCLQVLDLVLKYCSDINKGNWIHFFFFIVLVNIVASLNGRIFFICGSGFRLKCSRISLLPKRLQLGSKTDLSTKALSMEFLSLECASVHCRHICMD